MTLAEKALLPTFRNDSDNIVNGNPATPSHTLLPPQLPALNALNVPIQLTKIALQKSGLVTKLRR